MDIRHIHRTVDLRIEPPRWKNKRNFYILVTCHYRCLSHHAPSNVALEALHRSACRPRVHTHNIGGPPSNKHRNTCRSCVYFFHRGLPFVCMITLCFVIGTSFCQCGTIDTCSLSQVFLTGAIQPMCGPAIKHLTV